jgi:hypothetical protein
VSARPTTATRGRTHGSAPTDYVRATVQEEHVKTFSSVVTLSIHTGGNKSCQEVGDEPQQIKSKSINRDRAY